MKRKRMTTKRRSNVRRERDPIPWKYCFLTIVCGLLLVTGFFLAARLHFSSIDYGIKNAKLRQKVEKLKTDKRRMVLRREVAMSEINKTAYKIGFRRRTAENIEIVSLRKPSVPDENMPLIDGNDKTIKTFTNSKTLVKNVPTKVLRLEKKIVKTVISEPRVKKPEKKTTKTGKRGRQSDIDDQVLVAKKR